jgi:hypothetical protein
LIAIHWQHQCMAITSVTNNRKSTCIISVFTWILYKMTSHPLSWPKVNGVLPPWAPPQPDTTPVKQHQCGRWHKTSITCTFETNLGVTVCTVTRRIRWRREIISTATQEYSIHHFKIYIYLQFSPISNSFLQSGVQVFTISSIIQFLFRSKWEFSASEFELSIYTYVQNWLSCYYDSEVR